MNTKKKYEKGNNNDSVSTLQRFEFDDEMKRGAKSKVKHSRFIKCNQRLLKTDADDEIKLYKG